MIPVVFIHKGDHDYLTVAIEQANQRNEVVLLHEPKGLWGLDYEHMNFTTEQSIRRNIERWFSLLDWMESNDREEAFYCDSDVMVYCDVTEVVGSWSSCVVSVQIPYQQWAYRWSASAHCSYWTHDALAEFCLFITNTYRGDKLRLREKWQWHRETGTPGGICDMTLLFLWLEQRGMEGVVNNAQVIGDATFDHNINVPENYYPDEYQMEGARKTVILNPSGYVGWNDRLGQAVKFNALHFQGQHSKKLMKEYRG